jgi:two-component system, OmpR family, KDP operon response regulator KdpE
MEQSDRIRRKDSARHDASPAPLILAIEDEVRIRRFLKAAIGTQGYKFLEAGTGAEGLSLAASHVPDFIVLDLGLPDMDGLAVLRGIREWSGVPILILSARGQERDKVEALDAGADDYLAKPFGAGELLARIRAGLRRAARSAGGDRAPSIEVGELGIDLDRREVRIGGSLVHLTPIEFRLLACLARNAGRVLTHNHLLAEVWGPGSIERSENLRVFMAGLRRKIEADPANPKYIVTEIGVGYRLRERVE